MGCSYMHHLYSDGCIESIKFFIGFQIYTVNESWQKPDSLCPVIVVRSYLFSIIVKRYLHVQA